MPPKGRFARKKESEEAGLAPKERVLPRRERKVDLHESICVLVENYFTIDECERFMAMLQSEVDWKKQQIAVSQRGEDREKIVAEPRMTLFMSDPGICYEYSGRENVGQGWQPFMLTIKEKAERFVVECGQPPVTFNSVQLNRYNGPRHSLGMHADDEPDLLKGAPIVSASFGCTREFVIRKRNQVDNDATLDLADGSILLMGGAMQTHYLHGVPPGGQTGLRFNLTFRVCIPRVARTEAGHVTLEPGRGGHSSHAGPAEPSAELRQFIEENALDERSAAVIMRATPEEQRLVMARGKITEARNVSAMALTRLKEARAQLSAAAQAAEPPGAGAVGGCRSASAEGAAEHRAPRYQRRAAEPRGASAGGPGASAEGAVEQRAPRYQRRAQQHQADVRTQQGRPPSRA